MEIKIIAFGIAKDIVGGSSIQLSVEKGITVGHLKSILSRSYPEFEDLRSLAIAVNSEYAGNDRVIDVTDEVVLIPPVSGG